MRLPLLVLFLLALTLPDKPCHAQDYLNWPVIDTIWSEDNKSEISSIEYTNGLKTHELFIEEFHEDGSLKAQKHYQNYGLEDEWAELKIYYPEQSYMLRQLKHHFYQVGLSFKDTLKSWWPDGTLKRQEIYRDLKLVSGKSFDEKGEEIDYIPYMQLPGFPGGEEALMIYLGQNTIYPDKLKRKKITGEVISTFIVNKDGSISNIEILRSPHRLFSKEVIKVIKDMPNWRPGYQGGIAVRVQYNLPMNFSLRD